MNRKLESIESKVFWSLACSASNPDRTAAQCGHPPQDRERARTVVGIVE